MRCERGAAVVLLVDRAGRLDGALAEVPVALEVANSVFALPEGFVYLAQLPAKTPACRCPFLAGCPVVLGYTGETRTDSPVARVVATSEVTRILSVIAQGDACAAEQLLPLVYSELRKLAAEKIAREKPGQTLEATALVHEAYVRLVDVDRPQSWNSRGHFFAAAAEAMRRILVEQARRKQADKHGGGRLRLDLPAEITAPGGRSDDLVALDEALTRLEGHDPNAAQLVKLRFFAGLSHQDAAEALGISRGTADRLWALARAWLFRQMSK